MACCGMICVSVFRYSRIFWYTVHYEWVLQPSSCHVNTRMCTEVHFPQCTSAYKHGHLGLQHPHAMLNVTFTVTRLLIPITRLDSITCTQTYKHPHWILHFVKYSFSSDVPSPLFMFVFSGFEPSVLSCF